MHALIEMNAVARLWSRDISLWPVEVGLERSARANLSWLDLPDHLPGRMEQVSLAVRNLDREAIEDVVFIAMGGANLAAEALVQTEELRIGKRFMVLDTIHPEAIRRVEKTIDPRRTHFVVASKSGTDIAGHALFLHFFERLKAAGISMPGRQFIAATQEHSYLARLAQQYQFCEIFLESPGIIDRFSGLIHFGHLLAGPFGRDPKEVSLPAWAMRDACRTNVPPEQNPALQLAAFLGAGAAEGCNRLLLLSSQRCSSFLGKISHLLAGSTGKNGTGIVPVPENAHLAIELSKQKCMAAIIKFKDDQDSYLAETLQRFKELQTPLVVSEVDGVLGLGSELFKWEVATTLTSALLGVDPFHESDCQENKERTSQFLELLAARQPVPRSAVRLEEAGIELFAEGVTRQHVSTLNLSEALRTFFEQRVEQGYLLICSFLDPSTSNLEALQRIREHIVTRLGIPVLLASGPRYLHLAGEMLKNGLPVGQILMLTGETPEDIAVPGADYKFGQLLEALAIGEFDALARKKKLVLRLHFRGAAESGLAELGRIAGRALRNVRPAAS
jgi:transaldolase/glucose-6-phosphate isomerase